MVALEEKAGALRRDAVRRAEAAALASRARWSAIRSCCSSTSRRPGSIRSRAARLWDIVEGLEGARADGPADHALHGRGGSGCATAWRSSTTARSSRSARPRELIASLGAEHVVEFAVGESAAPLDDGVLRGLPSVEAIARDGESWRLTVREVHRAVPALLAVLSELGAEATALTTHHATLEDVFMSLTGRRLRDG